MDVVVVGGKTRADYLISMLVNNHNRVVAINDDKHYCQFLSSRYDIDVIWGNGTKLRVLEEADVAGFDIVVALSNNDADNLVICQLARYYLGITRQLCIVANPENTAIFKRLGVSAAISATAALSKAVKETIIAIDANPSSEAFRIRSPFNHANTPRGQLLPSNTQQKTSYDARLLNGSNNNYGNTHAPKHSTEEARKLSSSFHRICKLIP